MGANAVGSMEIVTGFATVNSGLTQCVAVSPSTAYDLMAHIRVSSAVLGQTFPRIQLQWSTDSGCTAFIAGSPLTTNTPGIQLDSWQTTDLLAFSSPATANGAMITLVVNNPLTGVAQFWYDDVQLGLAGTLPVTLERFSVE